MNNKISIIENKLLDVFALDTIKTQLQSLLQDNPKKIEAFKSRVLKMSLNYGLNECSPESIINCGVQALSLELPLESGQGYIVAYKKTAVFDCGYKGWQILAKRAGFSVLADVVYSCDKFNQNGFGFDRKMVFIPNFDERKGSNDAWAKENLSGVIVSIMEDSTKNKTHAFVDADMIKKIVGYSPSMKTENSRKFSPHENWAEQMFCAKAIKQVLSKFPIDLTKASQLNDAIQIVNTTESYAQESVQQNYSQERFKENFPKWKHLVETGKNKPMAIITQLSNTYNLTSEQLESVMKLNDFEPIDAEQS